MASKSTWPRLAAFVVLLALPMTAMAEKAHDLTDVKWQPVEIAGKAVARNTKAYVQFQADGAMNGHGGCNQMGARYTADKASLRVGPIRSTRRGCQGDVMAVESAFAQALEATRIYLRNDDKLTLKSAQGMTTVRLIARR